MSQNPNIELLGQYQFHPPSLSNDIVYLRFQRKKTFICVLKVYRMQVHSENSILTLLSYPLSKKVDVNYLLSEDD